MNKIFFRQWIR